MVTRNKRSPDEKTQIVMESLTTNISVAELCRKYNLQPPTFYQWKEKFIEGGKAAVAGASDASRHLKKENENLKRIIGELIMAMMLLKKRWKGAKDERGKNNALKRDQSEKITMCRNIA